MLERRSDSKPMKNQHSKCCKENQPPPAWPSNGFQHLPTWPGLLSCLFVLSYFFWFLLSLKAPLSLKVHHEHFVHHCVASLHHSSVYYESPASVIKQSSPSEHVFLSSFKILLFDLFFFSSNSIVLVYDFCCSIILHHTFVLLQVFPFALFCRVMNYVIFTFLNTLKS